MPVRLRDVTAEDLPVFFEHQRDPIANELADFPSREHDAFMQHWTRILADEGVGKQTVLAGGGVVGNVVSFEHGGVREVGYWIGREYWGRGIASKALSAFLDYETTRPLYARFAKHNVASRRVLEKCGFTLFGEEEDGFILVLR